MLSKVDVLLGKPILVSTFPRLEEDVSDYRCVNTQYELAPIVAGRMAGRRSDDEITLHESQGIALEDVAAASLIYERERECEIWIKLPF